MKYLINTIIFWKRLSLFSLFPGGTKHASVYMRQRTQNEGNNLEGSTIRCLRVRVIGVLGRMSRAPL